MALTNRIYRLIQSWGEFQRKIPDAFPDPLSQLQKEALKMGCSIHQKYPLKLLNSNPVARAYFRGLCGDVGISLPEPPIPPVGGQCEGVMYHAWGDSIKQVNPGSGHNTPLMGQGFHVRRPEIPPLPGKITRVQYVNQNGKPVSLDQYLSEGKIYSNPTYLRITHSSGAAVFSALYQNSFGSIVKEFRRVDGQPDLCGNPPPYYSEDPSPDPGDFTKTVNIYNYNNDGSVKYTIPITINIPVDIDGGFDFDFSAGGVDAHFDLGGIHYSGTLNVSGGGTTNNTTNNYYGGGDNTGTEFAPDELDEEPVPEEDQEKEKPGILWAKVVVSQLPTSGKRLVSADSDNVDHFAGFFSWVIQDGGIYRMEEIPIRKRRYMFRAPIGATGVKYYPVNGAILSVSVFTKKEV